ncbi:MAG TPA: hypothetical protein VGK97_04835 [Spongiibacteraceae bacterium]|jgi:hypothetical protein
MLDLRNDKYFFSTEDALEMIGGTPSDEEIQRLIEYYPTYNLPHRSRLLEDLLENKSPVVIAKNKIQTKGIIADSKQAIGGHVRWAIAKLRRFVRRVIYLRLRINDGKTRRQANQIILKNYVMKKIYDHKKVDSLQRTVRKDTQCQKLDKK